MEYSPCALGVNSQNLFPKIWKIFTSHRQPQNSSGTVTGGPQQPTDRNSKRDENRIRTRRKQKRESRKKVIVLYKCVAERVATAISGPDEFWKIFLGMCVKQHHEKVKTRQMLGLFRKLEFRLHYRMFNNGVMSQWDTNTYILKSDEYSLRLGELCPTWHTFCLKNSTSVHI